MPTAVATLLKDSALSVPPSVKFSEGLPANIRFSDAFLSIGSSASATATASDGLKSSRTTFSPCASPLCGDQSEAERRAGELLGEQGRKLGQRDETFDRQTFAPPKLEELGISRFQSHRWQEIAGIPED